jgi:hypothetical protein
VLLLLAPRSHCSPGCLKPSPQVASLQTLVQASSLLWLPSSQASPGPLSPSPQTLSWQSALQALPAPLLAAVVALLDVGLDQAVAADRGLAHRGAGAASLLLPPWSHCSPRLGCTKPSPQAGALQASVQPSSLSPFLPSSQASPGSTTSLPHSSSLQVAEQPSPPLVVAVVALLVGALVAVAADVELAHRVAGLARAVVDAVVTLLGPVAGVVELARRRRRCLALGGARGVVGVVDPVVALLAVARLHEAVAADRVGAGGCTSVSSLLPSSHCSVGATLPSPQVASAQSLALVVVVLVAVVAALAGADLAVAADVVGAVGLAAVHVAVVGPVVALLARAGRRRRRC